MASLANLKTQNNTVAMINYLKDNSIERFMHFTDVRNLASIVKNGGLFSWDQCNKNNIKIAISGGNDLSHSLDRRFGLTNYVRLSFCQLHPMVKKLTTTGDFKPAFLEFSLNTLELGNVLFSDINATDNAHNLYHGIEGLKAIDLKATQETDLPYGTKYKQAQAEILVEGFIPLTYCNAIYIPDGKGKYIKIPNDKSLASTLKIS